MAGRVRSIGKKKRNPPGFFSGISSAFSELILIILLFANGLSSYVAKKFARYCKLPVPCPLCSQLDGVLGDSKPVSFGDSLCEVHKSDISSLALCSSHRRLADARSMCDACLVSFVDGLNNGAPSPSPSPSPSLRCCSCCSVPFKGRSLARRLIQAQKPSCVDNVLEPLLHLREKPSRELTVYQDGIDSKVKITSYSESRVDDANICLPGSATDNLKGEFVSRNLQKTPPTIDFSENTTPGISDDMVSEKLALPRASLTAVERKHEIGVSSSSVGSDGGSDEMNRSQVENPNCPSSEVTSEQLPPKGLNIKSNDREVDVANGDAGKSFGSIDINFKTSQIMNAKLAPGITPSMPSSASTDLIAERESCRVPEDLKVRLSQISSNRWPEFLGNDATSNPQVGDEPRLSDASSSNGILNHIKRYNVDRYELGLDSLDGSLVGDVEGESTVEMDMKSLRILYKELEEERNASAIAANQAMAMINRLQEEKAAMQMEASQYLRMMEEQSEYDQEALQKLNDLLVDREMQIQDLEAEIDGYRKQFGCEPLGDCEEREYREYTPVSTPGFMKYRSHEIESNLEKNTIADFEDEKIYISECLKRLQKRLQTSSNSNLSFGGSELDVKEDGFLDKSSLLEENDTSCEYVKQPSADSDQEISQWNGTLKNNQKRESTISKDSSPSKEDSSVIKCFTPSSTQDLEFSIEETLKESNEKQFQMVSRRNDITALEKEIAQLSARLEALEVDKSFLDHAVDLLKNGCDGLQFIQEIASHLRELRKIGIAIHQEQIINA